MSGLDWAVLIGLVVFVGLCLGAVAWAILSAKVSDDHRRHAAANAGEAAGYAVQARHSGGEAAGYAAAARRAALEAEGLLKKLRESAGAKLEHAGPPFVEGSFTCAAVAAGEPAPVPEEPAVLPMPAPKLRKKTRRLAGFDAGGEG